MWLNNLAKLTPKMQLLGVNLNVVSSKSIEDFFEVDKVIFFSFYFGDYVINIGLDCFTIKVFVHFVNQLNGMMMKQYSHFW